MKITMKNSIRSIVSHDADNMVGSFAVLFSPLENNLPEYTQK
jgi:hypothetical protein